MRRDLVSRGGRSAIGPSFADVTFTGTYDGTSLKGNISVEGYSLDFTGTKPTNAALAGVGTVEGGAR